MKNEQRLKSLLGLAYKGGNLMAGTQNCKRAITSQRAKLVLLSTDCSDNTKKFFMDKCSYRGIPVAFYGNRRFFGNAVGKSERAVLAVLDEGFFKEIAKLIEM